MLQNEIDRIKDLILDLDEDGTRVVLVEAMSWCDTEFVMQEIARWVEHAPIRRSDLLEYLGVSEL